MKILNFGGATAIIEHNGKRFLFDPWMDEGIYHGAWHHFPPLQVKIEDIGHIDYIYISHIHEDHCSLKTLQAINPSAEIIITDREPNYVLSFLKNNKLNFKVHLVPPKTPTQIGDFTVDMLTADPQNELGALIDSILILKWDDFVIFNANDCPLYPDAIQYVTKTYKHVNLALLPYAGGSGYPSCYDNLNDSEKYAEAKRIFKARLDEFYNGVKEINPDYAMPFADQYVIVGSRKDLNKFMAHPPSPGAIQDHPQYHSFKSKILLLNSSQSFDFDTQQISPNKPFYRHTDQDREDYVNEHSKNVVYDYEKVNFKKSVPFARIVNHSRDTLWREQKRINYFIDFNIYIDPENNDGKIYGINLMSEKVTVIDRDSKVDPYLTLRGSRNLMIMMMINHISWNIADAGLFIDYDRKPNHYDIMVHNLINFLRI